MSTSVSSGSGAWASACSLTPIFLPSSFSSAHHSPSLKVLWGHLGPQGSPRPQVPPRPLQVPPKALLELPLAHPLLDPSFGPRILGLIPSCGAFFSTRHR